MTDTIDRTIEIVHNGKLCDHEAAHAAAALLQGLDVEEVRAPFWTLEEAERLDPTDTAGFASIERRSDPDGLRKLAIATLAPHVSEPYWPPRWPLTLAPQHGDETDLIELCKALELDRAGYDDLVADTYALTITREFERLTVAIGYALEQHGHLDERWLLALKAITEGKAMELEHATKTASVETTNDLGEFTAIAATYTLDRHGDEIIPGAFGKTIAAWQNSGKRLPLHWNHESAASSVIGAIDPATMRETLQGLEVSGKLDISTNDTAREAWRSMKNGAMSLSFGYAVTRDRRRDDGVKELHEIDLFEVSIVPAPANADTRVVSMKSAGGAIGGDSMFEAVNSAFASVDQMRRKDFDAAELRTKAKRIARECAPIQIASFDA